MKQDISLLEEIKELATIFRGSKMKSLDENKARLEAVAKELNLDTIYETLVFIIVIDRQCGDEPTSKKNLSEYLLCSNLDARILTSCFEGLLKRGYLRRRHVSYSVPVEIFDAIMQGKRIHKDEIQTACADQYEFCEEVGELVENRLNNNMTSEALMKEIEEIESVSSDLRFIQETKRLVPDFCSRVFFYDFCFDYIKSSGDKTSGIKATIDDMYDKASDKSSLFFAFSKNTHILYTQKLIKKLERGDVTLTNDALRLLYEENADAYVKDYSAKDRYEFLAKFNSNTAELRHTVHDEESRENAMIDFMLEIEKENQHLSFIKKINEFSLDDYDRFVFYLLCHEKLDDENLPCYEIERYLTSCIVRDIKREFKNKTNALVSKQFAALTGGGLVDNNELELLDRGLELFFEEDAELYSNGVVSKKDIILCDSIAKKNLYFEPELQRQISMLQNSLMPENYTALCERLKERNLPSGVAALLYGYPGTGKTESVMQMARATNRPIMHIDISATKSCWFGESEKKIKEVFNKYRNFCERSKEMPILLFNEADAVFSKRKDSNSSNVAQTENAIQNIILEEMESLKGILIATTNMADNLDKAFERRFLFKIRFDRPTVEAKEKIWLDKLSSLSQSDANTLATKYDFSGGEIDNITRKVIMAELIEGNAPTLEGIIKLCNEEKISTNRTKIGF